MSALAKLAVYEVQGTGREAREAGIPVRHGIRRKRRFLWGYIGVIAVVSGLTLGYVSQRASITTQELAALNLRREITDLSKRRDSLKMEITKLTALERINRIAREELNMVDASEAYVVSGTQNLQ